MEYSKAVKFIPAQNAQFVPRLLDNKALLINYSGYLFYLFISAIAFFEQKDLFESSLYIVISYSSNEQCFLKWRRKFSLSIFMPKFQFVLGTWKYKISFQTGVDL